MPPSHCRVDHVVPLTIGRNRIIKNLTQCKVDESLGTNKTKGRLGTFRVIEVLGVACAITMLSAFLTWRRVLALRALMAVLASYFIGA